MGWGGYGRSSCYGGRGNNFHGGGSASTNWRYLTEADRQGPRREEIMMSTTYAKERFALTTTDIGRIQGYRRPGGKGGTLTMYYVLDLKDSAIAKHGQQHFDNHVPEGKELSGVAATERAEKEEQERVAAQAARDRAQYAVVPPERLLNKGLDQLQAILIRCEGGRQKPPYEKSKAGCIERILKAGYDVAAEVAAMEKQKAADDERRAQQEADRAVLRAKIEKEAAAAKAKAEVAAALKAERVKMFEAGSLSIDELKYDEIQHQLSRLGVPGKERVGKKEDLRTRLKEACVGKSRAQPSGALPSSTSFAASCSSSDTASPAVPAASASSSSLPSAPAQGKATSIAPSPPPTAAPNMAGKKRTIDAFLAKDDDNADATGFAKPINVDHPNPGRARRGNAKASYAEAADDDED